VRPLIVTSFLNKFGALNHNFAALREIGFLNGENRGLKPSRLADNVYSSVSADTVRGSVETLVMYHSFHFGLRVIRE
jgi:hypothetical protein